MQWPTPHAPDLYIISLPAGVGLTLTVMGGELRVLSGVLHIVHGAAGSSVRGLMSPVLVIDGSRGCARLCIKPLVP
jgi:hypothetical protein